MRCATTIQGAFRKKMKLEKASKEKAFRFINKFQTDKIHNNFSKNQNRTVVQGKPFAMQNLADEILAKSFHKPGNRVEKRHSSSSTSSMTAEERRMKRKRDRKKERRMRARHGGIVPIDPILEDEYHQNLNPPLPPHHEIIFDEFNRPISSGDVSADHADELLHSPRSSPSPKHHPHGIMKHSPRRSPHHHPSSTHSKPSSHGSGSKDDWSYSSLPQPPHVQEPDYFEEDGDANRNNKHLHAHFSEQQQQQKQQKQSEDVVDPEKNEVLNALNLKIGSSEDEMDDSETNNSDRKRPPSSSSDLHSIKEEEDEEGGEEESRSGVEERKRSDTNITEYWNIHDEMSDNEEDHEKANDSLAEPPRRGEMEDDSDEDSLVTPILSEMSDDEGSQVY